jgi:hypothetical protein
MQRKLEGEIQAQTVSITLHITNDREREGQFIMVIVDLNAKMDHETVDLRSLKI